MALGGQVLFTPHLAPMNRGILATCYATAKGPCDPLEALREAYAGEPFVHVSERPPSTKWTLGSNAVHLTARYDARTGRVLAIAALDNLVKGAAGQMIQCANLMLGLDESAGLARRRESGRERHRRRRLRRRRLPCRDQAPPLRHGAGRHRRPQAGRRRGRLHPEQVRRAAGACSTGSGSPTNGGRARGDHRQFGQCQCRHRRSRAWPTPRRWAAAAAAALGIDAADVLVCSTGIIGTPLPMDKILDGHAEAREEALGRRRRTTPPRASSPPTTSRQGSGRPRLDLHARRHGQGLRHDRARTWRRCSPSSPPTPTCRATRCSRSCATPPTARSTR